MRPQEFVKPQREINTMRSKAMANAGVRPRKPRRKALSDNAADTNTTAWWLTAYSLMQVNRLLVLRQVGKLPADLQDETSFQARISWEREQLEIARAAFVAEHNHRTQKGN